MGRQTLYSIPPDARFLEVLARSVLDGTLIGDWPRTGAFWLADATIILPTRRARLALAETFLRLAGRGLLLPDIHSLGEEDEELEPFLPPVDDPPLPAPMGTRERQLAIARLVDAWARTPGGREVLASPPNPAEILALAASLGELIDDLATAGVPFANLRALPPEDVAANWQHTLGFLDIAFSYWPQRLAARGLVDRAEARDRRLRLQAAAAPRLYGERPVIVAGSTGTIPATADLIAAILALPRGALVLPGLDTTLTPAEHEHLLDERANPHGHPQFTMARLLRRLNTTPGAVTEIGGSGGARTALVRAALSPAPASASWVEQHARIDLAAATEGLTIIAAHTADEQARAVAVCARAGLADGKTVGIVTPDRNLGRRIGAELRRFGVIVDDPAGIPLHQSPAGRVARQLLAVAVNRFAPVDLVALLRNPAVSLGMSRRDVQRLTDRMELCLLRGHRLKPGIEGLRHAFETNITAERGPKLSLSEQGEAEVLLEHLHRALAPLLSLSGGPVTAAALAGAIVIAFSAATADNRPTGTEELLRWETDLAGHHEAGPPLDPVGLDGVLRALMEGESVRSRTPAREDIALWGQLEARLMNRDLIILAGLNEEVWPRVADPGPWLSRGMRLALGLAPPEWRQGQAAHDFEMAVGNTRAVIAFSERIGTAPALPSRLVQRLEALLGEGARDRLRARGRHWIDQARALDASPAARPAPRPAPRPAAGERPKALSVTEIETLFRSPYDVYARHVLKLTRLAPLGEEPDARERGVMVHEVFARFVAEGLDPRSPDALARLRAFAESAFAGLDAVPERRAIWLRRFETAAAQFLDFERQRSEGIVSRHAEIEGKWHLPIGFTLTGRADRIDIRHDGTADLIDFKTGSLPSAADMQNLLAPQLPLEAAMLEAGAFRGLPAARTQGLTFIKIGLGPSAFVPTRYRVETSIMDAASEVAHRLNRLVAALLLDDSVPMTSQILPHERRRYRGEYDHLARFDEWAINEGDESE